MENIPDTPEGIILESLLEGMNQYYSVEWFYGHYLYDAPIYRLSSAVVAQWKAKVNGKNLLQKTFKALELEFILSFSFLEVGYRFDA